MFSLAKDISEDKSRKFKKVPRGTSEYQAAWIISSDGDDKECEEEEEFGVALETKSLDDSDEEVASMVRFD